MRRSVSHVTTAALAALCLTAVAGSANAQKKYDTGASDTEIKIGNIMPYSGPASSYATIGKTEAGGFGLAVELEGAFPELADKALAQQLMEAAHQVCPYSNATRNNIEVKLSVAP